MLKTLFTAHPASVDETYLEHLCAALSFASLLAAATAACTLHAVLPFAFEKTGSRLISRLHERMVTNRNRKAAAVPSDLQTAA